MISSKDIEQHYEKNRDRYLKRVKKVLYNTDRAEEIVQDTFLKAVDKAGSYNPKRGSVNTWFNMLLSSEIRSELRNYQNQPTMVHMDVDLIPYEEPLEAAKSLEEFIEREPESRQLILYEYYVLGFNTKQVASMSGTTVTNVTTICNRFKKKLEEANKTE